MSAEAPLDAQALAAVQASDIVVVRGQYDHVELVLEALELPHHVVDGHQLGQLRLRPEQLLVINCPGTGLGPQVGRIRDFAAAGGSLFTTDWALRHVLEPAFPGRLEYNGRRTADDVVRIELGAQDNRFLRGVMDPSDDPIWWLEASSYPIRVVDRAGVEVLILSRELERKYGEAPVAVLFRHEAGEVFHMISHYFLQRTELRERRHRLVATGYALEKGITPDATLTAQLREMRVGDVESAVASARFFANVVASKKRGSTMK